MNLIQATIFITMYYIQNILSRICQSSKYIELLLCTTVYNSGKSFTLYTYYIKST